MAVCTPTIATDPVWFEVPLPFEVFGAAAIPIRWYALAYIAGLFLGLIYVSWLTRQARLWGAGAKAQAPFGRKFVDDLFFWVVIGVIAGGRLGWVVFYQPQIIWTEPLQIILGIDDGGMSFHGGLIGVGLAVYFTARAHKAPLLRVADAVAAATPIGLFFGRMANFINGELWGRPAPDLPWAMRFSGDPDCLLRHPSQLYEAGLEGLVLFAMLTVLIFRFNALARPGLIAGVFLAGYGVLRGAVELVREPDRFMPEALQGYVTMGMLLCVPMVILGAWLIRRALAQPPADAPVRA